MDKLLRMDNLWAGYGAAMVLEDVSLALAKGDSLAVLGRNGMGKTTLLASLMGLTRVHQGQIAFAGRDITVLDSHVRARAGMAWVPQERAVFRSLSVEENLSVVAQPGKWNLARVYELFPRLRQRRHNLGYQLSGGEQQMLAMARALMLNPRLLLLDEPLEGLAPIVAQELLAIIAEMLADQALTVVLVEQHALQILPIMRHAIVLERGRVVYKGSSQALMDDSDLLGGLLGVVA